MEGTKRGFRGFTLVELLVVVSIIGVLVALILPLLSRAKFHALVATCTSGQRQFLIAFNTYATDNMGSFPQFATVDPSVDPANAAGSNNLSELSWNYFTVLTQQYNMPKSSFFCPAADPSLINTNFNMTPGEMFIGFAVWVPHMNGRTVDTYNLVPPLTVWGARLQYAGSPPMPEWLQGPTKTYGDPTNPLITDPILLSPSAAVDLSTGAFSEKSQKNFQSEYGGHFWRGKLDSENMGYSDGRVELVNAGSIKARYRSQNAWNCK